VTGDAAPLRENEQIGGTVPIGRMVTPGDLAGVALFLASPEADHIVAETCNVDGGNRMS